LTQPTHILHAFSFRFPPHSYTLSFLFHSHAHLRDLHSFPTRRSSDLLAGLRPRLCKRSLNRAEPWRSPVLAAAHACQGPGCATRSEEHTSELQSRSDLVCRLLLEKKKKKKNKHTTYNETDH